MCKYVWVSFSRTLLGTKNIFWFASPDGAPWYQDWSDFLGNHMHWLKCFNNMKWKNICLSKASIIGQLLGAKWQSKSQCRLEIMISARKNKHIQANWDTLLNIKCLCNCREGTKVLSGNESVRDVGCVYKRRVLAGRCGFTQRSPVLQSLSFGFFEKDLWSRIKVI